MDDILARYLLPQALLNMAKRVPPSPQSMMLPLLLIIALAVVITSLIGMLP